MFKISARQLVKTTSRFFTNSNRFASTLAFLETTSNAELTSASLSLLSAAKQLNNPIIGITLNTNLTLEQIKSSGVVKTLYFSNNPIFKDHLPENITPLLQKLIQDNDISNFIIDNNVLGKNILPRLGALMDIQPISNVVKIDSETNTLFRPIYAGNIIAQVVTKQPINLLSIGTSLFNEYSGEESPAEVEELTISKDRVTNGPIPEAIVQEQDTNLDTTKLPELTSAKVIVAGGAGLKNKENFDNVLLPLAQKFNNSAAIGGTRVAVDNGYCPNSLQIGQTGKVVAPDLYFAIGLSGAIQHLAGMKNSKCIVAINEDLEAPICKIADYSLQGDLFKIVPELTDKL
ncbi:probable electron transfer flavoprotein subunit alpha, mitochondrial [Monosporozyma unispora]|nr:Electron transfer flavoprotein alpha-subunit [Kazachstania unispora]